MMMEERKKETIVLFPFMSQGHLNPFLALALLLEQKGYSIIFLNTPLNIRKLKHFLPSKSSVQLRQIPFNSSDHGLPSDSENTDDLPYNLVSRLLDVSSCLQQPFREVLSDLVDAGGGRPLCVIGDFFFGWSADVAHEFGIFHAVFSGAGGFGLACYYSMWLNLPHKDSDKGEFVVPDFSKAANRKERKNGRRPHHMANTKADEESLIGSMTRAEKRWDLLQQELSSLESRVSALENSMRDELGGLKTYLEKFKIASQAIEIHQFPYSMIHMEVQLNDDASQSIQTQADNHASSQLKQRSNGIIENDFLMGVSMTIGVVIAIWMAADNCTRK